MKIFKLERQPVLLDSNYSVPVVVAIDLALMVEPHSELTK